MDPLPALQKQLQQCDRLHLFLDYDGTLADFAPNPDVILPEARIISLLQLLVSSERVEPAVISGRKLAHLQQLLPVTGLLLAGSYGIEIQEPDGKVLLTVDPDEIKPPLQQLKPQWQSLLAQEPGFFLEDKEYTLALHAKDAAKEAASRILAAARLKAHFLDPQVFHLLEGYRFLEAAPRHSGKGLTVQSQLQDLHCSSPAVVYIGDDDRDEEAFAVVQAAGGFAIRVGTGAASSAANYHLQSPAAVYVFLQHLVSWLEG